MQVDRLGADPGRPHTVENRPGHPDRTVPAPDAPCGNPDQAVLWDADLGDQVEHGGHRVPHQRADAGGGVHVCGHQVVEPGQRAHPRVPVRVSVGPSEIEEDVGLRHRAGVAVAERGDDHLNQAVVRLEHHGVGTGRVRVEELIGRHVSIPPPGLRAR
nr:hypothetical protein [Kitasatospora cineracea]